MSDTAQAILDAVGGPDNITHFTHCATRLRFELRDASVIDKDTVESIDGVLGPSRSRAIATRSSSAELSSPSTTTS